MPQVQLRGHRLTFGHGGVLENDGISEGSLAILDAFHTLHRMDGIVRQIITITDLVRHTTMGQAENGDVFSRHEVVSLFTMKETMKGFTRGQATVALVVETGQV